MAKKRVFLYVALVFIFLLIVSGIVLGVFFPEVFKIFQKSTPPTQTSASSSSTTKTTTRASSPPIEVTTENLPIYLQASSLVKDLPEDGVFSLQLYNFDTGEREWEESYLITKGKVVEGSGESSDVKIIIHSKYVPELKYGFCSTIQKANKNGDLGFEYSMSKTKLGWKYKSMMSYKDCLGM